MYRKVKPKGPLKINPMTVHDTLGQRRDNSRISIEIASKNNRLTSNSTSEPQLKQKQKDDRRVEVSGGHFLRPDSHK